ncbi:hypothetical protein OG921_14200 [Aldersonia sp. NBC_00410]|uniref:hypothetical protein n=1 Tax=Aldersonia sp. NBC_00410 TaxID=2975954 RepID=UPI00225AAF7A|nr:hypothetical protein [Aldersonia sp. NBC_00410]MCX5044320.1 hypothetical protein [Aldersonia sp. NBC_00410]
MFDRELFAKALAQPRLRQPLPECLMYEGETLFDFIDATQSAGILPSDESWQFHTLMQASRLPCAIGALPRQLSPAR